MLIRQKKKKNLLKSLLKRLSVDDKMYKYRGDSYQIIVFFGVLSLTYKTFVFNFPSPLFILH